MASFLVDEEGYYGEVQFHTFPRNTPQMCRGIAKELSQCPAK